MSPVVSLRECVFLRGGSPGRCMTDTRSRLASHPGVQFLRYFADAANQTGKVKRVCVEPLFRVGIEGVAAVHHDGTCGRDVE